MFVNHLCEAKGEQDAKADEAQESFGQFVIASGDSPVAFDSLEEVFYSMTTPVKLWREWYSRRSVSTTGNAGVNSLGGRCLSEVGAIIALVADKGRILWQAIHKLFCQRNVGFVPAGQGNDDSLRTGIDDSVNLGV